jgi:hypothetical protein
MIYTTLGNFLVVDIHKPLSSTETYDFCRVRKDYLDKAKKLGKYLLVRTPNGERVIMPKDKSIKKWKVVKEVFLFKDSPMEMYELCVPKCEKKPNEYYSFH